jgi:hypothetical protein
LHLFDLFGHRMWSPFQSLIPLSILISTHVIKTLPPSGYKSVTYPIIPTIILNREKVSWNAIRFLSNTFTLFLWVVLEWKWLPRQRPSALSEDCD